MVMRRGSPYCEPEAGPGDWLHLIAKTLVICKVHAVAPPASFRGLHQVSHGQGSQERLPAAGAATAPPLGSDKQPTPVCHQLFPEVAQPACKQLHRPGSS